MKPKNPSSIKIEFAHDALRNKMPEERMAITQEKKRLTQKQELFCLKYFELGNASEAALIAGYKPRAARFIASENLTKPNIQVRIQELRQKVEDDSVMNVLERKQILTEIGRANMIEFVEVGQDGAWFNIDKRNLNSKAIQSVQSKTLVGKEGADDAVFIRVNLHDPVKAIDLLNKMDKLYSDGSLVNIDNRKLEIVVRSEEARSLLAEIAEGITPHGDGNDPGI